jgi:hypothetical protein
VTVPVATSSTRSWPLETNIVVALHDLGERYVELHGERVDRFLADLPDATSFRVGEPRPEAATSVGVRPP